MALAMVMNDPRIDLMLKRNAAEQAVEDLIQFLDDTEGDADLEPWLGFGSDGDDREGGDIDTCEGDELDGRSQWHSGESDGDCDDEPWLGWPNAGQRITDEMATSEDREVDNSDDEDTHDAEQTNEDGGNVLDEPHDEETDLCVTDNPHDAMDWGDNVRGDVNATYPIYGGNGA